MTLVLFRPSGAVWFPTDLPTDHDQKASPAGPQFLGTGARRLLGEGCVAVSVGVTLAGVPLGKGGLTARSSRSGDVGDGRAGGRRICHVRPRGGCRSGCWTSSVHGPHRPHPRGHSGRGGAERGGSARSNGQDGSPRGWPPLRPVVDICRQADAADTRRRLLEDANPGFPTGNRAPAYALRRAMTALRVRRLCSRRRRRGPNR
jgi:hypothetical protein